MPQGKDKSGWELPSFVPFRKGQKKLYEVIKANPNKKRYAVKLPTGYGKSWCACIAFATLRGEGMVDRALLVVPNDTQRSQYVQGLREDLDHIAIEYRGIERCDTQQAWVIKKSLRNESDIFVTTVQSIDANPAWFQDLMSKGRWLIVADEFHHYAEDNSWGIAINKLSYDAILGMSATPFRGDNKPTILDIPFDVEISIQDAITEKALRPIEVHECDYDVTFTAGEDKLPQTVMMSELQALANQEKLSVSDWELKRHIRYHTKYIHSILLQAINAWVNYESRCPGQNQILVFAMTCRHAESVAKAINAIAFPGLPEPFADWVGTGEGDSENRTQEQNANIIRQFQENKLPCLVQVNIAGEGFNNKRCSIGVMLDLVGDSPMKQQHIGRFVRVNPQATRLPFAVIFASADSPCLPLLKDIQEQTRIEVEGNKPMGEKGEGNGTRDFLQLEIPDLIILDANLQKVTKSYPYGTLENTVEAFKVQTPELRDVPEHVIAKHVEAYMDRKFNQSGGGISSEERRKQVQQQVSRSMGSVVNYVLRIRFGNSFPSTAKGDLHKKIHGQYARTYGCYQNELTEDELRQKHAWLKDLAENIKAGGIPTWMNL
jgi:superfamily II DNA or RNA helicase